MDTDKLVTALLTGAVEVGSLAQHAKNSDEASYLQGYRDALRTLAKAFQQSSPLAVSLFNTPVTVTEEVNDDA